MSDGLIEQVVTEWLLAYTQKHLKDFAGDVREKEQHWCNWLKEEAPGLIEQFTEDIPCPASAGVLKERWERWITDNMGMLVEAWQEDYDWEQKV